MIITISVLLVISISVAAFFLARDDESLGYYFLEIIGYSIIALLGYRMKTQNNNGEKDGEKFLLQVNLVFSVFFIMTIIFYGFKPNEYKYPPQAEYLSFGLVMSSLVFMMIKTNQNNKYKTFTKIITRFSRLSFDIYLVHILVLSLVNMLEGLANFSFFWILKYCIVLFLSTFVALIIDYTKNIQQVGI